VVIICVTIWPWPYRFFVQRFVLPGYESEFGFHGGAIRSPGSESSVYGIASVVPGGRLDRAGAKAGDIPVEYHDGMMSFYYALKEAAAGEESTFTVVSDLRDYPDRERRRKIRLAPK
jgi:S1-C subfamily serine protease